MTKPTQPLPGERLQKILARMGVGSRREIVSWISAGEVRVNGRVAQLGDRMLPSDRVMIGGQEVRLNPRATPRRRVILYNKPEGEVVTRSDPEGRATVFGALPRLGQSRWIAVGRLDLNTSGLLVLTTDGELANRLMHPSRQIEREYAVRVLGEVPPRALEQLLEGVDLDDGPARFDSVRLEGGEGANRWYDVVLKEGRNREVRRLWEAVGVRVSRLIRIRYGNLTLGPRLFTGHWREAEPEELHALLVLAGLEQPDPRQRPERRFDPAKRPGGARRRDSRRRGE